MYFTKMVLKRAVVKVMESIYLELMRDVQLVCCQSMAGMLSLILFQWPVNK